MSYVLKDNLGNHSSSLIHRVKNTKGNSQCSLYIIQEVLPGCECGPAQYHMKTGSVIVFSSSLAKCKGEREVESQLSSDLMV